jgi:hypothetical protein
MNVEALTLDTRCLSNWNFMILRAESQRQNKLKVSELRKHGIHMDVSVVLERVDIETIREKGPLVTATKAS